MDHDQLKTAIETGELAATLAGKARPEQLEILNRQDRFRAGPIPLPLLLQWAAANGTLAKVHDAADNPTSPVRSVCLALLLRLNDPTGLLTLDARNTALIAALAQAGILTAVQAQELGSLSPASYAEITFGSPVTEDDLRRAGH